MGNDKRTIKWTEKARLQLVEAVITVEEEIRKDSNELSQPRSADKGVAEGVAKWTTADKWDAILNLLPLELREQTWNHSREMYNMPKCRTFFYNLLKAYRDKVGEKTSRNGDWILTEPVITILKKREDLASGSGNANSLDACNLTSPHNDEKREDELQKSEDFDVNVERGEPDHVDDHDNVMEKATAHRTRPSRSVDKSNHAVKKSFVQYPTHSLRTETRSQSRDDTRDSLRNNTQLHARYDPEDPKKVMEKPQRIDLEFSQMNCWFQNQVIPLGKSIFSEIICSEIRSGKRPKLTVQSGIASEQFDPLVQKNVGRMIDNKIQGSFHKLRVQLVKELKSMSANLAKKILEDANALNSGPTSNSGRSRKRCPSQELPASSSPKEWNRQAR